MRRRGDLLGIIHVLTQMTKQPGVECHSFDMVDDDAHNSQSDIERSREYFGCKSLACNDIQIFLLDHSHTCCLGADYIGSSVRS